jgi:hypothetical protein
MLKKGALSTAEKFYIESHKSLEIEQIAKAINRSSDSVSKYLTKLKKAIKTEETSPQISEEPKRPVLKKGKTSEMMARHKGAVVMTPNASELGDRSIRDKSGRNMDHVIFKPLGNKK